MKQQTTNIQAVILAAGAGKRMQSQRAKVLHPVAGVPMVRHVMRAAAAVTKTPPVVVVGAGRDAVIQELQGDAAFAVQEQQLGTGHAVLCAKDAVAGADYLLILAGDMPLLTAKTVTQLAETCIGQGAAASLLYFVAADPAGYGRVLRDEAGQVCGVVEDRDATPAQRRIDACNAAAYCFEKTALYDALQSVGNDNAQGEYYLTDCIGVLVAAGQCVAAIEAAETECMGINDPVQLARADALFRARAGVPEVDA